MSKRGSKTAEQPRCPSRIIFISSPLLFKMNSKVLLFGLVVVLVVSMADCQYIFGHNGIGDEPQEKMADAPREDQENEGFQRTNPVFSNKKRGEGKNLLIMYGWPIC